MQYSWDLRLSDGELSLVRFLLSEHIEKLNQENVPIGTFARNLESKLTNLKPA